MSYRPITDVWFLARCKYNGGVKRYGGYLGGFPERARVLVGCPIDKPMLHVCGGLAKLYPYAGGFGVFDKTLDLDPSVSPDFLQSALQPLPKRACADEYETTWGGMLCDPPYSERDADQYWPGSENYPKPYALICNCLDSLNVGQRVGLIHYELPKQPKGTKFTACVGVYCGFGNRGRTFSVFEKL